MTERVPNWSVQVPMGGGIGPVHYCNAAQILSTEWDVSFDFAQLVLALPQQSGEQPSVIRNPLARIIMSPQHAKAFLNLLGQQVADYERQHGEIPVLPKQPDQPNQPNERRTQ